MGWAMGSTVQPGCMAPEARCLMAATLGRCVFPHTNNFSCIHVCIKGVSIHHNEKFSSCSGVLEICKMSKQVQCVACLQSHALHNRSGDASSSGAGAAAGSMPAIRQGTGGPNKSRYRGVSYDKKKRKWRVQIKVRFKLS
jgi:hypothetical protein